MSIYFVRHAICFLVFVGSGCAFSYWLDPPYWVAFLIGIITGLAGSIVAMIWTNLADYRDFS